MLLGNYFQKDLQMFSDNSLKTKPNDNRSVSSHQRILCKKCLQSFQRIPSKQSLKFYDMVLAKNFKMNCYIAFQSLIGISYQYLFLIQLYCVK